MEAKKWKVIKLFVKKKTTTLQRVKNMNAHQRMQNGTAVVDILDNNKEFITVEINDKDFQFIFN